jgi:pimeloyl-ACP methyl ester carboxylesterase
VEGPLILVAVNGTRLAVDRTGSGEPAVVLVHAGVADRRMWEPLVAELPGGLSVVRYDMRGFGESELPPQPFSHTRDLLALLDALELEKIVLVGASMGGAVALEAAGNWPDRVSGLALLDAAAEHDWSPVIREFGAAEDAALEAGDIDKAVELNLRLWVDGPRATSDVDPAMRALVGDMQRRAFELQQGVDAEEDELETDLRLITAPTVVAVGELDVADFHDIARDLAGAIPNVVEHRVIPEVTHLPALERPREVAELVAKLL